MIHDENLPDGTSGHSYWPPMGSLDWPLTPSQSSRGTARLNTRLKAPPFSVLMEILKAVLIALVSGKANTLDALGDTSKRRRP